MRELFLDIETTGLSYESGHRIVEIACLETKNLITTSSFFHKIINLKGMFLMKHLSAWIFK